MDGWFQDGWLRVIWKWNKSVCAWEYWIRVGCIHEENYRSRRVDGDTGGGVCCLLEVPEGCSCQVNILQCTLEGVEVVVGKYIRWKSVPLFGERSCI